jgi:PAS domain S-box-containing protein
MDKRLDEVSSFLAISFKDEADLDDLVFLAAEICQTPIASITLVDDKKQYPIIKTGNIEETSSEIAFCNYTIHEESILEINDAQKDIRFINNPLVTGEPYITFYAGIPLVTSEGLTIGALCVIDQQQKKLSDKQVKSLHIISKQVMQRLELAKKIHLLNESALKAERGREVLEENKITAELELGQMNERLKLVGTATADAIWDWDLKTNSLFWGDGFRVLFGYALDSLTDISSWIDHLHVEDKDRVVSGIKRAIDTLGNTNWVDEYRYLKADGSIAIVLDKGIIIRDKDGNAVRMVGAMQDVSKIKELEREIAEQKLFSQKQKTEVAIQSQEQERQRIGLELHDNINQLLANAKLMIDTAQRSTTLRDVCIANGYESITDAINEVRKLSHSLIPPVLDDPEMFSNAVCNLIADVSLVSKLNVSLSLSADDFRISGDKVKLAFFRIIQEQVSNILKHAKASLVTIKIEVLSDSFQLMITDNGIGFDVKNCKENAKGIGLRNMQSRAELVEGSLEVSSKPGEGCTIKARVPRE